MLELTLRSLSNLDESLHHSYYFFVPTSVGVFFPLSVVVPLIVLPSLVLLLLRAAHHHRAGTALEGLVARLLFVAHLAFWPLALVPSRGPIESYSHSWTLLACAQAGWIVLSAWIFTHLRAHPALPSLFVAAACIIAALATVVTLAFHFYVAIFGSFCPRTRGLERAARARFRRVSRGCCHPCSLVSGRRLDFTGVRLRASPLGVAASYARATCRARGALLLLLPRPLAILCVRCRSRSLVISVCANRAWVLVRLTGTWHVVHSGAPAGFGTARCHSPSRLTRNPQ